VNAPARAASGGWHYKESPVADCDTGADTWITRGANFVTAVSKAPAGTVFARSDNPDEYMVVTHEVGATISAGTETIEVGPDSLTIVPPGASKVTLAGAGEIVRVFSSKATDLAARASNADAYPGHPADVAPLVEWPEPVGGYKLRSYRLADHVREGTNMRIFRSRNLMLNVMTPRMVARDTSKLTPHSHADYEQGSLAIGGTYVHHLRYPWTPDLATWRDDEHVEMASPSVLVIPPTVIHTSRNIGDEPGRLIDVFAPPRMDFSKREGLVANADEYPMPSDP
jgi:mannose-6-phosphate isomerase-like protein (cupin superfamily)